MKALSLAQPYASLVAAGLKTIETRGTRIHYRGDLVICSTRNFDAGAWSIIRSDPRENDALGVIMRAHGVAYGSSLPLGVTLALVGVVGCRELVPEDWPRSFFYAAGRWAWLLENARPLEQRRVRGMNGQWPIDDADVVLKGAGS